MIREITEQDCGDLEFMDPDWDARQFADAVSTPGAAGLICPSGFLLGVEVEGELFVSRMVLPGDGDHSADLLCEVRRRWRKVHHDLGFDLLRGTTIADPHGEIAALVDGGWVPSLGVGCMRMRMTLS